MFVVGWDSSIETEELALASFSACWAGELGFSTCGAVLRKEKNVRPHKETRPLQGAIPPQSWPSTGCARDIAVVARTSGRDNQPSRNLQAQQKALALRCS